MICRTDLEVDYGGETRKHAEHNAQLSAARGIGSKVKVTDGSAGETSALGLDAFCDKPQREVVDNPGELLRR